MKKTNKKITRKMIFTRLAIIVLSIYAICVLINQQRTLNSYASTIGDLNSQIVDAKQRKEELADTKNNIDSREYIEKVAREKLDMYFPNERIYVNIGN